MSMTSEEAKKEVEDFTRALSVGHLADYLNSTERLRALQHALPILLLTRPALVSAPWFDSIRKKPEVPATFSVRIFPDDETTEVVYPVVTHAFMEAGNTILTMCLPNGEHAHWPRERFRHYTVTKNPATRYLDDPRHT